MRIPWVEDTVAHRFAIAAALSVGLAFTLVSVFNAIGGTWSQDPLDETGLPNEAADMLRIIEAAPRELRTKLCVAATTRGFRLDWYSPASIASASLGTISRNDTTHLGRQFFMANHHVGVAFEPGGSLTIPPSVIHDSVRTRAPYMLAIEMADHGWLVFTVINRSWGLAQPYRWAIRVAFLAISIILVTALVTHQFSKPIERLAEAVRQFGIDRQAPAIVESGPRELRQVVKTFNDMRSQIQRFVADRTTMLAAISHDLRTPLTRIRLRGELIENCEQQARLFRDVDEMQGMVDGALAFFRDDAVAEQTTTFDLPHVIVTIANDYADHGTDIVYTGPAHALYWGRPFALKRALTNLVENAIKYGTTPEIGLSQRENSWNVTVTDRGPGIPAESLGSMFLPYQRLDKSRNRTTGGMGLGLTVAQAIVHCHGGRIILENGAGGGLEARVVLPIDVRVVQPANWSV
ncbi:MAG: hypothetical protein QOD56_2587 [Gammaproteobacteria bacterium]|jgi:signal transduction histidine kinase|nr:hypothetical protein [Gammaproteobacteria bacterium]